MASAVYDMAKGIIAIESDAIAKIVGIVATGCYGVVGMAHRSKTDEFASLLKKDSITKGIKVSINDKKVSLDVHIIVQYGVNINVICESIISNVKYQVKNMTSLDVDSVNVYVEGTRVQD